MARLTIPLQPEYPVDVVTDLHLQLYYDFGGGDRYPIPEADFARKVGSYYRFDQGSPMLTVNRRYYESDRTNSLFRALLCLCYATIVATLLRSASVA